MVQCFYLAGASVLTLLEKGYQKALKPGGVCSEKIWVSVLACCVL